MKDLLIRSIKIYQLIFSVILKNLLGVPRFCRFDVTCSDYAIASIKNYGALKGAILSGKRLLRCQPFYKGGYI